MTVRVLLLPCALVVSGCNAGGGPAFATAEVRPGLASCLAAIDRPDVAADPEAPMSTGEITALVTCTAERAGG